jgi:hypothetical protein
MAFAACVSAQKSKSAKSLTLSASDKTEITNQIFDDGFEKLMQTSDKSAFQTCLVPLVENEKVIFISTETEKKSVKPDFEGYRFIVMSDNQMRKQVQTEKGECYFRVTPFIISGSKVKVSLARYFQFPAYIYAVGFQYEFEKVSGNWKKKLVKNYQIQS